MDTMSSRFLYAVLASIVLHGIVLFGVTIRPPEPANLDNVAPPLEVVLVNAKSASRPVKADVLAQHNLDGGGNTDADRRARTPLPVTRNDKPATELTMESHRPQQSEQEARKLLTQAESQVKLDTSATQPQPQVETKVAPNVADLMQRSLQIARLEAQIDKDLDAISKRPRRTFVGSRAQEFHHARYIEDWRLKVERVGTLNYPQAARDQKVYGSLRLTVSIRADGSVEKVEINVSSGQKILDAAAIRTVHLAAPYAPLPPDISKDTDILSITRTWTHTSSDRLLTE